MIENVVMDIGNVILNFNLEEVIPKFTKDKKEQKFIIDNIINSPEWLGYSLIDTGYVSRKNAISMVCDRTNHIHDELIKKFWNNYNTYAKVDTKVLELIKKLKGKGYKVYLLSNINEYTYQSILDSGLFSLVNGYVLSYLEHQVKPNIAIYNTLIQRYNLLPSKTLFIDDNLNNVLTADNLGFIGKKVIPDNYESVYRVISSLI